MIVNWLGGFGANIFEMYFINHPTDRISQADWPFDFVTQVFYHHLDLRMVEILSAPEFHSFLFPIAYPEVLCSFCF